MTAGRLISRRERPPQDWQRCSDGAWNPSARSYWCPLEQRYSYIGNSHRPPASGIESRPLRAAAETNIAGSSPSRKSARSCARRFLVRRRLYLIYSPADTFPQEGELFAHCRIDEVTPGGRRSLRPPDTPLEPEDEEVHLRGAQRHPHHRPAANRGPP